MRASLSKKIITIFVAVAIITLLAIEDFTKNFWNRTMEKCSHKCFGCRKADFIILTPTLGWRAKEGSYLLQPSSIQLG